MTKPIKTRKPKVEVLDAAPQPMEIQPVPSQAKNVLVIIENAVSMGADVPTMERLYALYEKNLEREQKAIFAADFVKMKPKLPLVIKKKSNIQTSSKYAPLEDVNQAIDPILATYNFGTSTKIIKQDELGVWIRAELWHASGHIEATEVFMPWDDKGMAGKINKTMPHAISSSVSYGKRVAICALLNISTGDDKDGNNSKQTLKPKADPFAECESQKPTIREALANEATRLSDALVKRPAGEKRGELLMKNINLMKQLEDEGMTDIVAALHKLAEEVTDAA
jgi:hypothetical protein